MKLGLGTVQFGSHYGVSNRKGVPSKDELACILSIAAEAGIGYLDTAPSYGDSESRLGVALQSGQTFQIVTKTPVFGVDEIQSVHADALRSTFLRSLENLRQGHVYGLLIHHADAVTKPGGSLLLDVMRELVQERLVQKLGVSVYTGTQIDDVLRIFRPDIIQLPLNVFDQRLIMSGHLAILKNVGVEIHARSVFLQGLLLMEVDSMPPYFNPIRAHCDWYRNFLKRRGMTKLEAALKFVNQIDEIDVAIIGVTGGSELRDIIGVLARSTGPKIDMSFLAVNEERMVNPSMWKL